MQSPRVQDNLALPLDSQADLRAIRGRLKGLDLGALNAPVPPQALRDLKFGECLPAGLAVNMLSRRAADVTGVEVVLRERIREVKLAD